MRSGYYRKGGRVKPVNTSGGLTMLKPKETGLPSPDMAVPQGAMGKQRLDRAARGGRKWIAGAIKHPGALTAKAKKAGMSPMAFAHKHSGDSGQTGRQAKLAVRLRSFHKK